VPEVNRQPTLTFRLPLLGREIGNVKSYSMASNFMTSTDGWSVTVATEDLDSLRDLEVQPVELYINDNLQVIGRIDSSEIGGNGLAIKFTGRDQIADLVECHVDPSIKLKKEMRVDQAVLLATSPAGFDEIAYQDEVGLRSIRTGRSLGKGPTPAFKQAKLEEYKAQPGESIYAFINRIIARQGATAQPGVKRGQLVISEPNYVQEPTFKAFRALGAPEGAKNNILEARAMRDLSSFPTHVLVTSKQGRPAKSRVAVSNSRSASPAGGDSAITNEHDAAPTPLAILIGQNLVARGRRKPGAPQLSPPGRLYRLQYLRDTESRNQAQVDRASLRLVADRLKDSLHYDLTMRGHEDLDTGATYAINTFIRVDDELCGIHETLWIEGRSFDYQEGQGPITKLVCWRPGSFIL